MAALARLDSKGRQDEEAIIKALTQRFDVGIVFKLSLSSRQLQTIQGLTNAVNLTDLDVSCNSLTKIDGLENALALRRLNVSSNKLRAVDGIWHLTQLEALHLQDNAIDRTHSLNLLQLAQLPKLRALYLQNLDRTKPNPVCGQAGYKDVVVQALPALTNLDGERRPATSHFMEQSGEAANLILHPPPPHVVEPQPVDPWLQPGDTELGPVQQDPALAHKSAKLVKLIDNCHMLVEVLGDEQRRCQQALEAQRIREGA